MHPKRNLPLFLSAHKICIVCEGNEEFKYLKRLIDLKVWSSAYQITLVNAQGNGNIPARYQDLYQNGSYEIVLIFCDTEKKPNEQYKDIKRKVNFIHGLDTAASLVIFWGNPCTMQIISKHWTDVNLKSPAKKVNSALIEKFTEVKNYKGREDQIDQIMLNITSANYVDMKKRIKNLPKDDSILGSSNFSTLIKYLEDENCKWIDKINSELEQ